MNFEEPLVEAKLIRRYKKFLADVQLCSGEEVTVHCTNPSSMTGLSDPGSKVLLSETASPRRKFTHQLEIIYSGRTPVGIHTGRPITLVAEAIMKGQIPELAGYSTIRRIPRKEQTHNLGLVLEGNSQRTCFLAAESVSHERDGIAAFPDMKHREGLKLLEHMTNLVREGNRAMVIFVVQRLDVQKFTLADQLDSEYCEMFRDSVARGVETLSYRAKISRKSIELDKRLAMELN